MFSFKNETLAYLPNYSKYNPFMKPFLVIYIIIKFYLTFLNRESVINAYLSRNSNVHHFYQF